MSEGRVLPEGLQYVEEMMANGKIILRCLPENLRFIRAESKEQADRYIFGLEKKDYDVVVFAITGFACFVFVNTGAQFFPPAYIEKLLAEMDNHNIGAGEYQTPEGNWCRFLKIATTIEKIGDLIKTIQEAHLRVLQQITKAPRR